MRPTSSTAAGGDCWLTLAPAAPLPPVRAVGFDPVPPRRPDRALADLTADDRRRRLRPARRLLAWFYGLTHNYAISIALIAVVVMVIITPLTLKSTKGMLEMQRLAPEMRSCRPSTATTAPSSTKR